MTKPDYTAAEAPTPPFSPQPGDMVTMDPPRAGWLTRVLVWAGLRKPPANRTFKIVSVTRTTIHYTLPTRPTEES